MTDTPLPDEPTQILMAYFDEMTAWETDANNQIPLPPNDPQRLELIPKLRAIQARYCAAGAKLRGLNCSTPPTFSHVTLGAPSEATKSRIIVPATKQIPGFDFVERFEFVLIRKDDRWFISKRVRINHSGERFQISL